MQITDIRIRKINESSLKAFASIVIDDAIVIHNIKIIEGDKGLFIAMPGRKSDKGFMDFVHPINSETRILLQNAILEKYNKITNS